MFSLFTLFLVASSSIVAFVTAETNQTGHNVRLRKRIVDGIPAHERYPWMASVRDSTGHHFCGASMIEAGVAITAGHCFHTLERKSVLDSFRVSANRYNGLKFAYEEGGVDFTILDYIVHPNYNSKTYENDLCILKIRPTPTTAVNVPRLSYIGLDVTDGGMLLPDGSERTETDQMDPSFFKRVILKDNVDSNNYLNPYLYIAGWGRTQENGTPSPILLETPMDIASESACRSDLNIAFDMKKVVCAVGDYRGGDTCQGDSGGPLFTITPSNTEILIGIVSFGIGCGTMEGTIAKHQIPGVYTSVTYFRPFIDAMIKKYTSS